MWDALARGSRAPVTLCCENGCTTSGAFSWWWTACSLQLPEASKVVHVSLRRFRRKPRMLARISQDPLRLQNTVRGQYLGGAVPATGGMLDDASVEPPEVAADSRTERLGRVLPVQELRLHRPCLERRPAFATIDPSRGLWKEVVMVDDSVWRQSLSRFVVLLRRREKGRGEKCLELAGERCHRRQEVVLMIWW